MNVIRRLRRWLARVRGKEHHYARVEGKQLLEHDARDEILRTLKREPGLCFQEIQDRVGLAPGTTQWHLRKLQRSNFLNKTQTGRHTRYAPTGMDKTTLNTVVALRDPSRLALARIIQRNPGITQTDLANATGIAQSTASHHLKHLIEENIITKRRDGRANRYYIQDGKKTTIQDAIQYVI